MKRNGFTLVEMLVILIFLSLIFLFAVPSTINMLKKSEDDKYNVFLNDVYLATEAYLEKNKDDYPSLSMDGVKTYIYMKDLVDEGLISTNLINPKYCVDDVCSPKKIAECTDKTCSVDDYTIIVTKDEDGKYVYSFKQGIAEECEYSVGQEFTFDYTGNVQTFKTPCSGNYKIEVWGAQGGYSSSNTSDTRGGYGGYSNGMISLSANSYLYIGVGGQGKSCNVYGTSIGGTTTCGNDGGFNGGGSTRQYVENTYYGSGGGATHIATQNGQLSELSSYTSNLLIVAGGGGGASRYQPSGVSYNARGGDAGGHIGSVATYTNLDRSVSCTGGTQSSGGTGSDTSGQGFGHGGNLTAYVGPGGGSGYYGGGTSEVLSCGGSGYIGNSLLTNKKMVCYNCATSNEVATKTESNTCHNSTATADCSKEGNGYAKITYLGE